MGGMPSARDLTQVDWSRIPAPPDDGAARHLAGMLLPDASLPGTDGVEISLRRLYPVFPPDRNAEDVVAWLREQPRPPEGAAR